MKYAADLHIHSALSPCADNDMTPNNIVNMAKIKGLDIIAVTDHNSGANLSAVSKCALKNGLLFIPGMEVETMEEVHLICLFSDLDAAMEMHDCVTESLPEILNREDIFGQQLIYDENDQIIGKEKCMLITATKLTVNDVFSLARKLGGAVVPAHVDRMSYSIISNLGMIPVDLAVKYLEISRECDKFTFRSTRPELDGYRLIKSSDAHSLGNILERESLLELGEIGSKSVIKLFV